VREFYRKQMFNKCVEPLRNPLKQLGVSDELLELAKKHGTFGPDLHIGRGMFVELKKIPKETGGSGEEHGRTDEGFTKGTTTAVLSIVKLVAR